jgi:hypothetical protein
MSEPWPSLRPGLATQERAAARRGVAALTSLEGAKFVQAHRRDGATIAYLVTRASGLV